MKGCFSFWSWSTTIFNYYNNLILIYDVLSSYRLYNVQFKEVKILWGLGARDWIWGLGAGGRITQTPFFTQDVIQETTWVRSSHSDVFLRRTCGKFTGEHSCRSVISIKLQSKCSPVSLLHIFKTLFLKKTSGRLLLLSA